MDDPDSESSLSSVPASSADDVDVRELKGDDELKSDDLPTDADRQLSKPLSRLEALPAEIIENIASLIPDDVSLRAFFSTCPRIYAAVVPMDSGVWRNRFLHIYDYPIIKDAVDFSLAYRLRGITLRRRWQLNFDIPESRELTILDSIKDLIIEAFNAPPNRPTPELSLNLVHFSSKMEGFPPNFFLVHPFTLNVSPEYSKTFESLRLSLAHLVLNASDSILAVSAHPVNYDIRRIYLLESEYEQVCLSYDFANGGYFVNTGDLVHILNFFSFHLCSDNSGSSYRQMGRFLASLNRLPKPWSISLPKFSISDIPSKWIGHYTCLHPDTKNKKHLNEKQSCGEDWDFADPMVIEFAESEYADADKSKIWPPLFSEVPGFSGLPKRGCRYVRGLAHYEDIYYETLKKLKIKRIQQPPLPYMDSSAPVHPLTALHFRGAIHPLPDQDQIPGWSRIIFFLYKHTDSFILNALRKYFGDGMGPFIDPAIWEELIDCQDVLMQNVQWMQAHQLDPFGPNPHGPSPPIPPDEESSFQLRVQDLLKKIPLTQAQVTQAEENYVPLVDLDWDYINFGYAYEGVLTPGGKVMLGRFSLLDLTALWNYYHRFYIGAADGHIYGSEHRPVPDHEIGVMRKDLGSFVLWADNQ